MAFICYIFHHIVFCFLNAILVLSTARSENNDHIICDDQLWSQRGEIAATRTVNVDFVFAADFLQKKRRKDAGVLYLEVQRSNCCCLF